MLAKDEWIKTIIKEHFDEAFNDAMAEIEGKCGVTTGDCKPWTAYTIDFFIDELSEKLVGYAKDIVNFNGGNV